MNVMGFFISCMSVVDVWRGCIGVPFGHPLRFWLAPEASSTFGAPKYTFTDSVGFELRIFHSD